MKLLKTLSSSCADRSHNLGAHPATVIRELKLWFSFTTIGDLDEYIEAVSGLDGLLEAALLSTAKHSPDGVSRLRGLHLSSDTTIPIVFSALSLRPQFGHLEELDINSFSLEHMVFTFLEIPKLKSLAFAMSSQTYRRSSEGRGHHLVKTFVQSLDITPSASPGLTVLHIDLTWTGDRLLDVQSAVNSLRLPRLQSARIRVFVDLSEPDFGPFLEAHPALLDVSSS
ncbi:hypothetical protein FB45DRAFT_1004285 [Roridomyces roridus]|uniref:Uncharacterized protein n=1 Tax=Roridomyces roridus TaxID=1738132 RepID=A0AAD7FK67_9AGAR|nr:hypothetical protein FB45DRAFT_1004285 [Roridomyces roridus]